LRPLAVEDYAKLLEDTQRELLASVFTDQAAVPRYLDGRNIEIVAGDIAETCRRLEGEDLVLTFIDTDNYPPAKAAPEVVRERTVPGGAIVFDHFTGSGRFRYTLGERIAAPGAPRRSALVQTARNRRLLTLQRESRNLTEDGLRTW
jgi:predicted O-methyltransferase YrrM